MGFLNFIFGMNHIIEDEFFEKMLYLTFKDASKNYYECRRMFQPSNSLIELGVEGDENGSSQIRKDFFSLIEKNRMKSSHRLHLL